MKKRKLLTAISIGLSLAIPSMADESMSDLASAVDEDSTEFMSFFSGITGENPSAKENIQAPTPTTAINNYENTRPDLDDKLVTNMIIEQAASSGVKEKTKEMLVAENQKVQFASTKGMDGLYIHNIPETSMLTFKQKLDVMPYRTEVIFHDGKRVHDTSSLDSDIPTTVCKLIFSDFGIGRRIKESDEFLITRVEKDATRDTSDPRKVKREVAVLFDNEHLKMLYCSTTEKTRPLTIGDVKYQFGSSINFKLRDFVEIKI